MKYIFAFICTFSLFVVSPTSTNAFVFEDSSVLKLSDSTALYSISYSARFRDHVTYHPVTASHIANDPDSTLIEVFGTINPITVYAFIESSADIRNGKYRLPINDDEILTLHALVSISGDDSLDDVSIGLKRIPINGVIPGKSSSYFPLTGIAIESAHTDTVMQ